MCEYFFMYTDVHVCVILVCIMQSNTVKVRPEYQFEWSMYLPIGCNVIFKSHLSLSSYDEYNSELAI